MVRKGGIREQRSGFAVRHERFLLYPTYFHEKPAELASRFIPRLAPTDPSPGIVRFRYVADVAATWWVTDLDRLLSIEFHVGLTRAAMESRFNYRNNPGVHVIALQVAELRAPADVVDVPRYRGCVSWVSLDHPLDVAHAHPVLAADAMHARVAALTDALGQIVEKAEENTEENTEAPRA